MTAGSGEDGPSHDGKPVSRVEPGARKGKSGKVQGKPPNLLTMVPIRMRLHEIDQGDGHVIVLVPRFKLEPMIRAATRLGMATNRRVHLDETSSAIWLLIDGRRDVGVIAEMARTRFGERLEPLHSRIAAFFHELEDCGLARFRAGETDALGKKRSSGGM